MINWTNFVSQLINGLALGALLALISSGLTIIYGTLGVLNLAHGAMFMLGGYAGYMAYTATGSFIVAVAAGALALMVFGLVLERVVIRYFYGRPHEDQLLVTFGLSIVIENGLQQFFTANSRGLGVGDSFITASFSIGSQITIAWLNVVIFALAVIVLLGLQQYLSVSKYGRLIRAVADDREAAQLSGANYRHVFGIAAAIAFGTVAIAGMFEGMITTISPTLGTDTILLFAFASVVIGGLGSLWGTLLGGVVLGVAQAIGAQINPSWEQLAGYAVFLVVLVIRPQGLTSRGAPA